MKRLLYSGGCILVFSSSILLLFAGSVCMGGENNMIVLKNEKTRLLLPDPTAADAYYRGVRFASAGMVSHFKWKELSLFGEMELPDEQHIGNRIGGTAEEFDIYGPQGYDETPVGGTFMKIGVGFLQRPDTEPYRFSREYPLVQAAENTVQQTDEQNVTFIQTLSDRTGTSGYRLEIKVQLKSQGFIVYRHLTNTGFEKIRTEQYSHNFCAIDGSEPGCEVSWETPVQIKRFLTVGGQIRAGVTGVIVEKTPDEHFYYESEPVGGSPPGESIRLLFKKSDVELMITTDRSVHRIAVWGSPTLICPEPFVQISVDPGETVSWATSYAVIDKIDVHCGEGL
jgi:hypothetical protein